MMNNLSEEISQIVFSIADISNQNHGLSANEQIEYAEKIRQLVKRDVDGRTKCYKDQLSIANTLNHELDYELRVYKKEDGEEYDNQGSVNLTEELTQKAND